MCPFNGDTSLNQSLNPSAAPSRWPYREHRTMAQVDAEAFTALAREWRKGLAA